MPFNLYGRRPLTRLEGGLYAAIAAILLATSAYHLLELMELAERTAMEATVNRLNAAASTRLAYEVARGTTPNVTAWAKRNPFEIANVSAGNFAGEVDSTVPGAIARGTWAFDASRAELIYQPRLRTGLQTSDPEGAVRFRAVVSRNLYMLVPTSPYRWE